MKLSPALIVREIAKVYNTDVFCVLSKKPILNRPRYPDDTMLMQPGRLYIMSRIPALTPPEGSLVLVNEKKRYSLPEGVVTVDAGGVRQLFDLVSQIFDRYEDWWEALTASRLQGQSVQELLELSQEILPRPLVVMGMDFSVIASVKAEIMEMGRGVFGSTAFTYEIVNELKRTHAYESVRELDGVFYYQISEDAKINALCVNIKKYGKSTYRLMMMVGRGARDLTDGFILEMLAELIEHALLHNTTPASREDQTIKTTLITALNDKTADYVAISQRLDGAGWRSSHEYLCIVLQLSYLDQKNLTANAICSYVENIVSASCAFQQREHVVVFIDLTLSSMDLSEISSRLGCFVRDSLLKAGYSRILLGHFNLRRQYVQARIALDTGSRLNPSFWVHRFNDIAFPYILQQATRTLPGYMVSHERLLKLKYADENNGTEYLRTLRMYLDHHLNAVQTAKDMYIHRSTFLYRLERIKEILGTDLNDPEELLYLMLSFRLMDREEPGT